MSAKRMHKKKSKATPAARKRPGSFVWKLTCRQLLSTLCILLAVDLSAALMYAGSVLWVAEDRAENVYRQLSEEDLPAGQPSAGEPWARPSLLDPGMEVAETTDPPVGLPVTLDFSRLPSPTLRHLDFHPSFRTLWQDWDGYARYDISLPADAQGSYLRISFDLTGALYRFSMAMSVLLCIEGVMLLLSITGTRRSTGKTLEPIQRLADMAYSMSVEPQPDGKNLDEDLRLAGTINTLNTITAKHLDTRLKIDEERVELQGLAGAINGMLDRLNAAYQSQLRFVSDASHELRTPIAVIQGYANLLDRWGKEDPEALQESIDAIKGEAQGMQALVEQLLFLARSDNNTVVMNMQTLDVTALAEEVLRDSQIIDGAHTFASGIAPGLWAKGDSGLIKQALRIFVDNAIKYTPDGERITVSGGRKGGWVEIAVSDNGIGIAEEDLPQVFERFYRSDESRTRKTGGTGLGLSIAKWIVIRHGGHLDILSRKDMGTRLTMRLPVTVPEGGADAGE